jgi:hypothetical protein
LKNNKYPNMKLFLNTCLIFFAFLTISNAQPFYESYDWDANPKYSNKGVEDDNMMKVT